MKSYFIYYRRVVIDLVIINARIYNIIYIKNMSTVVQFSKNNNKKYALKLNIRVSFKLNIRVASEHCRY